MNINEDIQSLTDFKRHTSEFLEQLRRTGRPLILTINGKAELVVQDAHMYQEMLDRVEAVEGIRHGLEQMRAGKVRPVRQAFDEIRKRRKIPKE